MSTALFYDNYLTSPSMLTATSYAPAAPIGITRTQAGGAVFEVQGAYTNPLEKDYRVEIQTAAALGALSNSTFRWSDTGGEVWNVQQVVIVPATWLNLNDGMQVRFSTGPSLPDVVSGDYLTFRAIRHNGVAKLLDWSRNTEFESDLVADGSTYDLIADFGVPVLPDVMILWDHNFIASTVTRLQSSSTSTFTSTPYNQVVTYQASTLVHLISGASAARYWRLRLTAGTGQAEIRASEWYLGRRTLVEPPDIGYRRLVDLNAGEINGSRLRYGQGVASPTAELYEVLFGLVQDAAGGDYRTLQTVWESVNDWRAGDKRPLYVVLNDSDLTTCGLYHWANSFEAQHRYLDRYDVRAIFQGLTRSLD